MKDKAKRVGIDLNKGMMSLVAYEVTCKILMEEKVIRRGPEEKMSIIPRSNQPCSPDEILRMLENRLDIIRKRANAQEWVGCLKWKATSG